MNILETLRRAFAAAAPEGADPSEFAAAVRPATDPKFGDYQANGCMAAAKARKRNPRELAQDVAARVDLGALADTPEIAGPGFLNVRLRDGWVADELGKLLKDEALGLVAPAAPKTVVIDYSSPNVAKPMHVGHIRSTVIGDSLARIFDALGHRVIRDNHLGDWGSQFGMILWGWKNHRIEGAFEENAVAELSRLYRFVQSRIREGKQFEEKYEEFLKSRDLGQAEHPQSKSMTEEAEASGRSLEEFENHVLHIIELGREIEQRARAETAKLHAGDPENRELWRRFMPHCLAALEKVYERLDVRFDEQLGESYYDPMLAGIVADLEAKGLAIASKGATVVFVEGSEAPFIVRKTDGAYNYATTDLATIQHRDATWHPDLVLYVVDHRQGDHFKQLFDVARRWGHDGARLEHVAFGTILDQKRRPYKTRDGDVVGLESLLDEAVINARKVVDENSPHLDESAREHVAEVVGLGAIKYADLSQNRLSDYVFDWGKMLATQGNTATYLQYAYARIRNIFAKGEIDPESIRSRSVAISLAHPAERALGVQLLRLPESLELAADEFKPNILADYLFDLANKYSTFYQACPVLKAETAELRDSRLALCDLTARTLKLGLHLLGIGVVDRM